MAERRRINPREREIHLPAPVIHRIQAFLSGKQAAQTALLSKSWYNAWLIRPNLYFKQDRFALSHVFWNFVGKTVQRYEELNLNFNSLYLRVRGNLVGEHEAKLIRKVLRLGVNGIDCKIKIIESMCDLPLHVLEADTVMRLSLFNFRLSPRTGHELKWSRLKSLRLEHVYLVVPESFFHNAFPCLEDLTLVHCRITAMFGISSTSLKFLSITTGMGTREEWLELTLNVPNIRKFIFFGFGFPFLNLGEVSREWEAEISTKYLEAGAIYPMWYYKMKSFLQKLGLSMCKVSLSIRFYCFEHGEKSYCHDTVEEKVPTVENLMFSLPSLFYGIDKLFETLLWCCRPKVITQYWFPESSMGEEGNNKLIKYMCRKMFKDNLRDPYRSLGDVKVEIFQEFLGEWQLLPWTTLLHDYKGPENKRKIRFLLEWTDG